MSASPPTSAAPSVASFPPQPSPSLDPAPPLPLSPSAPSSSFHAPMGWPKSHQGFLLVFWDPFSSNVASLKTEIEAKLHSSGNALPATEIASDASHIVLDPECFQNSGLRAARPDQHVVRLEWVEDSLLHGFSVPEGGYQIESAGFGGREARPSRGERMDGVEGNRQDDRLPSDGEGSGETRKPSRDEDMDVEDPSSTQPSSSTSSSRSSASCSSQEKAELAQLLAESTGTLRSAYLIFQGRHPKRTLCAIEQQKPLHKSFYEDAVRRIRSDGSSSSKRSRVDRSESNLEFGDDDKEDRYRYPSTSRTSNFESQPRQRSKVDPSSPSPSSSIASTRFFLPSNTPSSSASASTSTSTPTPSSSSYSSRLRAPTQYAPIIDAIEESDEDEPTLLESDAFRMVGVAPSSFPPSTPFCFFCGTTQTSTWYMIRNLVGWREVDGKNIVSKAPSRSGSCNGCYSFHLKQTKVESVPAEIWARGEMERLLWVTEQLLVRGMKKRREVVEGRR